MNYITTTKSIKARNYKKLIDGIHLKIDVI